MVLNEANEEVPTFNAKEIADIINGVIREKSFSPPNPIPEFTKEEVYMILNLVFYKPPTYELRVRQRVSYNRELTLKRKLFLRHLFDEARLNRAKAARMAGYSSRSAKQIAYKIMKDFFNQ